jgi:hypothetical protein
MVLAILWVCGSHWRSNVMVGALGNKGNLGLQVTEKTLER